MGLSVTPEKNKGQVVLNTSIIIDVPFAMKGFSFGFVTKKVSFTCIKLSTPSYLGSLVLLLANLLALCFC